MTCLHQQAQVVPSLIPFMPRVICDLCGRWTRPNARSLLKQWHPSDRARRISKTLPYSAEDVQNVWDIAGERFVPGSIDEQEEIVRALLLGAKQRNRAPQIFAEWCAMHPKAPRLEELKQALAVFDQLAGH
jgi:hypothetical protein